MAKEDSFFLPLAEAVKEGTTKQQKRTVGLGQNKTKEPRSARHGTVQVAICAHSLSSLNVMVVQW